MAKISGSKLIIKCLKAEGVEFPELKTVILASQEKVVMGTSIKESIYKLSGHDLDDSTVDGSNETESESDETVVDYFAGGFILSLSKLRTHSF